MKPIAQDLRAERPSSRDKIREREEDQKEKREKAKRFNGALEHAMQAQQQNETKQQQIAAAEFDLEKMLQASEATEAAQDAGGSGEGGGSVQLMLSKGALDAHAMGIDFGDALAGSFSDALEQTFAQNESSGHAGAHEMSGSESAVIEPATPQAEGDEAQLFKASLDSASADPASSDTPALNPNQAPTGPSAPSATEGASAAKPTQDLTQLGAADAPGDNVLLHVRSLQNGAHTAAVEVQHPELGRIQLEMNMKANELELKAITQSFQSAMAIRATESILRANIATQNVKLASLRVDVENDEDKGPERDPANPNGNANGSRRSLDLEA